MPEGQASLLDVIEETDVISQVDQQVIAEPEETTIQASTAPAAMATASTSQPVSPPVNEAPARPSADARATVGDAAAPLCYNCGNQTMRAGTCYVCTACGSTTGCS